MILTFSPQLRNDTLTLAKQGDLLTINGVAVDLSPLLNGYRLPSDECRNGHEFLLTAERSEVGELGVTVLLPHGSNASEAVRFPSPINNPADGVIEVPV